MKILSWMQSRLKMKKPNTALVASKPIGQATTNEEFIDWPQSLLAIGTFGISNLREDPQCPVEQDSIKTKQEEEEEEDSDTTYCENRDVSSRGNGMVFVDHKNNKVNRKKSLTFLFNKIFTSRNTIGLNHATDPSFDKSRMDKILSAILKKKKIHPQTCTAKAMSNKHLITMSNDDDDDNHRSTWVKTDSEYIVLEI